MSSLRLLAHGLVQRADLPVPDWLFAWGATAVLVASFAGLAVLWPTPRLQPTRTRSGTTTGTRAPATRVIEAVAGATGVAVLAVVVWAGLAGVQQPQANLAPTAVLVIFWVGGAFASALVGDVFYSLSPWRALGRLTGAAARRARNGAPPRHHAYPQRLGCWPAAAGLLLFGWVELVSGFGESPSRLAVYVIVYSVATWGAMVVYGVERWHQQGEAFAVYFGLFARIAPVEFLDGRARLRMPLSALAALPVRSGQAALLAVMIGTVTFDGLGQGALWREGILPPLWDGLRQTGLSAHLTEQIAGTIGLLTTIGLVAGLYECGCRGAASVSERVQLAEVRGAFVHSLVPIAFAYVVAHYLSLLLLQGQMLLPLASDPLGRGWDLLGTASGGIDYGVIGQRATWYTQVTIVVAGHVAGLTLAHDRALALYTESRAAVRSQYWMLGVMATFTSLALWLLSQANA